MKIFSISLNNFGPFSQLQEFKVADLATLVGKNDVGKTHILKALDIFFENSKMLSENVYKNIATEGKISIEVAFKDFPAEINVGTERVIIADEKILNSRSHLKIKKTYPQLSLDKPEIELHIDDFEDSNYSFLLNNTLTELKTKCRDLGIIVPSSVTTLVEYRKLIRSDGSEKLKPIAERYVPPKNHIWKGVSEIIPTYIFFETDTNIKIDQTSFQKQFKEIIKKAISDQSVVQARSELARKIDESLQLEMNKIMGHLSEHLGDITDLKAVSNLSWEKAVDNFEIIGKDKFGHEESMSRRGAGIRRLLMLSFIQYLAEREHDETNGYIFSIEEPENCLHPSIQRELAHSFKDVIGPRVQIILTTHSPIIAGMSSIDDLSLIVREDGMSKVIQEGLKLEAVASELGIEPSDQITGFNACVFVEGPDDVEFFSVVAEKLKSEGITTKNFTDAKIGFIMCGGQTVKQWIDLNAMKRINRRYCLIVDSDLKAADHSIAQKKIAWKTTVEADGGKAFILKKREIENYLHKQALISAGKRPIQLDESSPWTYDDFTDMKKMFGPKVFQVIKSMTAAQIMDMDQYSNGVEIRHELVEIVQCLLELSEPNHS